MAGPEDFLNPGFIDTRFYEGDCSVLASSAQEFRNGIKSGVFERLEVKDCRDEYMQQYVSRRGDLLLIQNSTKLFGYNQSYDQFTDTGSDPYNATCTLGNWWDPILSVWDDKAFPYIVDPHQLPSFAWQCPWPGIEFGCNITTIASPTDASDMWEPFGGPVDYCWSERLEEECTLTFNVPIGIAVIVCNLLKALCMSLTLLLAKRSALMTLGDAIESFLCCPDPHTTGLSILSADRINFLWQQERITIALPTVFGGDLRRKALDNLFFDAWSPTQPRWWRAATPSRFHCFVL